MQNTRAKPHLLVRAVSDRVASAEGRNASILDLARMRRDARDLRARARRAEQEASLLERSIDGVLALRLLEERESMDAEDAASA
jgi:hypothetical protein